MAQPERAAIMQAAAVTAVAAVSRVVVSSAYFGWEESDYGNLMLSREVLDSGFTWFRPEYMPGWYVLAAALRMLVDDARLAGLIETITLASVGIGALTWTARRLAGPGPAWVAGLWLCVQPDLLLEGASTLRAPVYTALLTLALLSAVIAAPRFSAGFVAAAFLTRMDAAFAFFAPVLGAAWSRRGRGLRATLPAAVLLLAVLGSWQFYVTIGRGEGLFLSSPFDANVSGTGEAWTAGWFGRGLRSTAALLAWTLPRKVSIPWLILAGLGAHATLSGRAATGGRVALAFSAFGLAYWAGVGFVGQHEPNHNLYWTWLLGALPPLALLGALGLRSILDAVPGAGPRLRAALAAVATVAPTPAFAHEAAYQMKRAEAWYRPQLEVARWLEDATPPGTGLLLSSIPEVWVQRRHHDKRVGNYWTLPSDLRDAGEARFGEFLLASRIHYVIWFREDWTEANAYAPSLAAGERVFLGPAEAIPLAREDGYGWILYGIRPEGGSIPPGPPPWTPDSPGPGWGPWTR